MGGSVGVAVGSGEGVSDGVCVGVAVGVTDGVLVGTGVKVGTRVRVAAGKTVDWTGCEVLLTAAAACAPTPVCGTPSERQPNSKPNNKQNQIGIPVHLFIINIQELNCPQSTHPRQKVPGGCPLLPITSNIYANLSCHLPFVIPSAVFGARNPYGLTLVVASSF